MEKTKYTSLTDGLTNIFLKRMSKNHHNGLTTKERNTISFHGKIPPMF